MTWPAPGSGDVLRACHTLEVTLLFGNPNPAFLGPEPPPDALALGDRFRTAWTAFATTGDPGWPAYDPQQSLTQVFDTDPVVTAYPEDTSRRLWYHHRFQAAPHARYADTRAVSTAIGKSGPAGSRQLTSHR